MHIEKQWTAPNGAVCTVHRVQMILVEPGRNVATINSHVGQNQPLIGWQDRVEIPDAAFTGAPLVAAASFLIAEGGYLEGGVIVEVEPTSA